MRPASPRVAQTSAVRRPRSCERRKSPAHSKDSSSGCANTPSRSTSPLFTLLSSVRGRHRLVNPSITIGLLCLHPLSGLSTPLIASGEGRCVEAHVRRPTAKLSGPADKYYRKRSVPCSTLALQPSRGVAQLYVLVWKDHMPL